MELSFAISIKLELSSMSLSYYKSRRNRNKIKIYFQQIAQVWPKQIENIQYLSWQQHACIHKRNSPLSSIEIRDEGDQETRKYSTET